MGMNWLVYHVVSGHAFFTGVLLMVVAAVASTRERRVFHRIAVVAGVVGLIAIAISSTPIPYWMYAIAGTVTLIWVFSRYRKPWRKRARWAMVAAWLFAMLFELQFHFTPSLKPTTKRSLAVIGDSVTAGIGGDETSERWPQILERTHGLAIQDISHVGETAASALKRAEENPISAPLVIIEIGGNDILGSTTTSQFERDLDALLGHLARDDRQLVMFELPLPPFFHEYGRAQRMLAAKYNVALIPKRVFLSVIAGGDSTLDTIHLTQSGHQLMADCVWNTVGNFLAD